MTDGELVRPDAGRPSSGVRRTVRRWRGESLRCATQGRACRCSRGMAQEALLRRYRSLSSLAEPEKFGAWLCGIASAPVWTG